MNPDECSVRVVRILKQFSQCGVVRGISSKDFVYSLEIQRITAERTYEGSLVDCDGFVLAFFGQRKLLEASVVGHGETGRGADAVDECCLTGDVWRFAPGPDPHHTKSIA